MLPVHQINQNCKDKDVYHVQFRLIGTSRKTIALIAQEGKYTIISQVNVSVLKLIHSSTAVNAYNVTILDILILRPWSVQLAQIRKFTILNWKHVSIALKIDHFLMAKNVYNAQLARSGILVSSSVSHVQEEESIINKANFVNVLKTVTGQDQSASNALFPNILILHKRNVWVAHLEWFSILIKASVFSAQLISHISMELNVQFVPVQLISTLSFVRVQLVVSEESITN